MIPKPSLIILDVGSHKLEELQTLLSPFPRQFRIYFFWFARQLARVALGRNFSFLRNLGLHLRVIRYFFFSYRRYNLTIISIDPNPLVALPFVRFISRRYKTIFLPIAVLGHDAKSAAELKTLYQYDQSISNSIYRKNRVMSDTQDNVCVAIRLSLIWEGLVREGIVSKNSEIILRMNCEGAELGVLKDCVSAGLRIRCLIGSLGDIYKIHGEEAANVANEILDSLKIDYKYFKGDEPDTWPGIISFWDNVTSDYVLRK